MSNGPSPLVFWLLGSVLIYALATNALWLATSFALLPGQTARAVRTTGMRWLWEIGRFVFYLGIPYLVLGGWPRRPFQGLLSLPDMGLVGLGGSWTPTRWLGAVGTGLGLGSVTLAILIVAWRQAHDIRRLSRHPWWAIVTDAIHLEVHWAFYRAALALLVGDPYLGVFAGLGLVYVEWTVSPFWRQGWAEESPAAGQWLRAALALVSAIIFLLTHNLWICLAVHWLVEMAFYSHNRQKAHNPPAVVG